MTSSHPSTLEAFLAHFADDRACYRHLERLKWPDGFRCRRCGPAAHGYARGGRVLVCRRCGRHESVLSGTLFESTKISIRRWFIAIWLMVEDKRGISAMRLSQFLGVSYLTAWRMLHKLRMAMAKREERKKLRGLVEFDDAYFGGRARGKRGRGAAHKGKVLVLIEHRGEKAGRLVMRQVDRFDKPTIHRVARDHLVQGSHVHTDNYGAYSALDAAAFPRTVHQTLPREAAQVMPWVHRAISLAKRWILGTHHGVSLRYLQRYLDEFCYRFNRRGSTMGKAMQFINDCVYSDPIKVFAVCI